MRCDNWVEVKFGLLGRLEVVDGGRDAAPRRRKQRALLALLLLRAGEMVTVDEAVFAERNLVLDWSETRPSSP